MKASKEDNERKEEYDPRKHKLQNGVVILKFLQLIYQDLCCRKPRF